MTLCPSNIPSPSAAVVGVVDDMRLESIIESLDLASSYARSGAEAAWRGDRLTLGVHLQQLRLSTIEAIRLFKSLGSQAGEEARAA